MPEPSAALSACPPPPAELSECRAVIDEIDRRLLELLNRRARAVLTLSQVKRREGLPVLAPDREQALLNDLQRRSDGPLPPEAVRAVFGEIVSACRALQQPLKVAFLGPELTFSHQAVRRYFGGQCDLAPQGTVSDVFREVERGRAQVGMVPLENSCEGGVGETLDCLMTSGLTVCGEVFLPVSQCLMAACALEDVVKVYSHPAALAQCRAWLQRNLPRVQTVEAPSTSVSARRAAAEPGAAALGSELAAERHGLAVLARDVQDLAHNTTRFLVLGSQACPPSGLDRTSLIFTLDHRPGSLHQALGALARRGINISRLESRPSKTEAFEYAFFADLDGHLERQNVAEALVELAGCTRNLKVLGSYPAGRRPGGEVR